MTTAKKKFLTKVDILGANDVKRVEVDVPEWGGTVIVTTMSAGQRDAWELLMYNASKDVKEGGSSHEAIMRVATAGLVSAVCVDEDGNPLFSNDDVEALGKKSSAAMKRVTAAAQELNRLNDAEIETLAKN